MVEISYNKQTDEYSFFHDGKKWELEKLKKHIRNNGHERENASVAVPNEVYEKSCEIAKGIETIFDEKGLPKNRRQGL